MPDATYTHGFDHHSDYELRRGLKQAGFALDRLEPEMRLLDVGCGPGTITVALAARVASVVGIDLAEAEIEKARALGEGVDNVSFEAADAFDLPYDAGAFDVAFCNAIVEHVADPVALITEMMRVTRRGGVVALRTSDSSSGRFPAEEDPLGAECRAAYMALWRHNGGDPAAGRRLLEHARAAGLTDCVVTATIERDPPGPWRDLALGLWTQPTVSASVVAAGMMTAERHAEITERLRQIDDDEHPAIVPWYEVVGTRP